MIGKHQQAVIVKREVNGVGGRIGAELRHPRAIIPKDVAHVVGRINVGADHPAGGVNARDRDAVCGRGHGHIKNLVGAMGEGKAVPTMVPWSLTAVAVTAALPLTVMGVSVKRAYCARAWPGSARAARAATKTARR